MPTYPNGGPFSAMLRQFSLQYTECCRVKSALSGKKIPRRWSRCPFFKQGLDARDFGLPQARERVFTISSLDGSVFSFDDLIKTPAKDISEFLLDNDSVPRVYDVTQPSILNAIGETGIRRATIIRDYAYTITTRQDRTPAQIIDCGGGRYRYLTERECWRLMGYSDSDYERAEEAQSKNGRYYMSLYKQAGNSIAVPIFESIFRKMLLGETA